MEQLSHPRAQKERAGLEEEVVQEHPSQSVQPDEEVEGQAGLRALSVSTKVLEARRKNKKKSRIKALVSTILVAAFFAAWTIFIYKKAHKRGIIEAIGSQLLPAGTSSTIDSYLPIDPENPFVPSDDDK